MLINFSFFAILSHVDQELTILYVCKVCKGEGNGTPLQYSCLENPMDGGAWKGSMGSLRVGHD